MPSSASSVSPVSVVLALPHARLRSALAALLDAEAGVRVVASVGTAEEAAAAMRRGHPDVVVADLSLVATTGRLLARWGPVDAGVPIVVTSFEPHAALAAHLRARGAAAYVSKEQLADRLPAVLRAVAAAQPVVAARV